MAHKLTEGIQGTRTRLNTPEFVLPDLPSATVSNREQPGHDGINPSPRSSLGNQAPLFPHVAAADGIGDFGPSPTLSRDSPAAAGYSRWGSGGGNMGNPQDPQSSNSTGGLGDLPSILESLVAVLRDLQPKEKYGKSDWNSPAGINTRDMDEFSINKMFRDLTTASPSFPRLPNGY